jgi:sporulation protein YlmC with PRC-barrel domain
MTKTALVAATALALLIVGHAVAQQPSTTFLTSLPQDGSSVTNYYKQNVYDPSDTKIGEVADLLIQKDNGRVPALIISVGGFLGIGEKDVAVAFEAVKATTKNSRVYLVMNTTKDELKKAPGLKYDRTAGKWIPDTSPRTQ